MSLSSELHDWNKWFVVINNSQRLFGALRFLLSSFLQVGHSFVFVEKDCNTFLSKKQTKKAYLLLVIRFFLLTDWWGPKVQQQKASGFYLVFLGNEERSSISGS